MKFRIDWGWIVLLGPMLIVVSVTLFELPAWLSEQASLGATHEASVHHDLGRSAMKNGRYREAIAQFKTTLMMDPEYTEAYMNLGIVYNLIGEHQRAIPLMKKAAELDTTRKESVSNNLGMVYAEMGDYEKALSMFRESLAINEYSVPVYRNIAEIAIQREEWETAEAALNKAVEYKPSLENLYRSMKKEALVKFIDNENYEQIKECLNREITDELLAEFDAQIVDELTWQDPKLAEDFRNLGRVLTEQGRLEEAIPNYQAALKILPGEATICNKLGILYARTGDYEKAMVQFKEAVRIKPDYEDAKHNLKRCQQMLGEG